MATAIKETPVLTGKDARRFLEDVRKNEHKKVPKEEYERAKKVYEKYKLIGCCSAHG